MLLREIISSWISVKQYSPWKHPLSLLMPFSPSPGFLLYCTEGLRCQRWRNNATTQLQASCLPASYYSQDQRTFKHCLGCFEIPSFRFPSFMDHLLKRMVSKMSCCTNQNSKQTESCQPWVGELSHKWLKFGKKKKIHKFGQMHITGGTRGKYHSAYAQDKLFFMNKWSLFLKNKKFASKFSITIN